MDLGSYREMLGICVRGFRSHECSRCSRYGGNSSIMLRTARKTGTGGETCGNCGYLGQLAAIRCTLGNDEEGRVYVSVEMLDAIITIGIKHLATRSLHVKVNARRS